MKVITRKAALGDVLWVEPLIRYFLAKNEEVILVTDFPSLFQHYPTKKFKAVKKLSLWLDICRRIEKRINFGHFINFNGYYEKHPKKHILEAYFLAAGLELERGEYPKLYLNESEKKRVIDEKYVVLHLETQRNLNFRNVYGIDWNFITEFVKQQGYQVVEVAMDPALMRTSHWFPTHSIRDLIRIIYNASYFIGIDSGPSHLASAMNIPSILFFGSVNPKYRHFFTIFKGVILQGSCEFAGCYHESIGISGTVC